MHPVTPERKAPATRARACARNTSAESRREFIERMAGEHLEAVDAIIETRLRSDVALVNQVSQYIVHSGGKRLRPLLVVLSARALGYRGTRCADLAAVVELIHTATLLHDDVVDTSELRRGQATANRLFGNDASILVGDFLYSRAFQMMVGVGSMRIMRIMADTTNVIAEGEVLQLLNRNDPETTEERYLRVIRAKTARLFEAAAQVGATIAGAGRAAEGAMARFGHHLGTTYQLVDDLLDYRGSTAEIGKNIGDDLAEGKPTLPLIHAMRHGSPDQVALLRNALRRGEGLDLRGIARAVESTGGLTYTERAAEIEMARALEALSSIPHSQYREALEKLAEFSMTRSH